MRLLRKSCGEFDMKEYNVKITPYAYDQICEIRDYITLQLLNPQAARNTILAIQDKIAHLSVMPTSIKPVTEEPWHSRNVRKITVKNFYIYFWINEKVSEVHVIAVAYAKRNQTDVLNRIKE